MWFTGVQHVFKRHKRSTAYGERNCERDMCNVRGQGSAKYPWHLNNKAPLATHSDRQLHARDIERRPYLGCTIVKSIYADCATWFQNYPTTQSIIRAPYMLKTIKLIKTIPFNNDTSCIIYKTLYHLSPSVWGIARPGWIKVGFSRKIYSVLLTGYGRSSYHMF